MRRICKNGTYRDMTAEEEAEIEVLEAEHEKIEKSAEEKLAAIEKIYEEAQS